MRSSIRIIGELRKVGDIYMLETDAHLLSGLKSVRARATIDATKFSTYMFEKPQSAALVLPARIIQSLALEVGSTLDVGLVLENSDKSQAIPYDVQQALDEAGASLDTLTTAERRQSLMLVKEAATMDIRRRRIEALVRACLEMV